MYPEFTFVWRKGSRANFAYLFTYIGHAYIYIIVIVIILRVSFGDRDDFYYGGRPM